MIFAAIWFVLACVWFVQWWFQRKHKARMDAHDREFAQYSWSVPINAMSAKPLFVIGCAYLAVAAGYFLSAVS